MVPDLGASEPSLLSAVDTEDGDEPSRKTWS